MQGCKRIGSTLAHLVFRKIKSPTYCVKAKEYTLTHCLLAPLKNSPASDASLGQPPLAKYCVLCIPSGTGGPPTVSRPTKPPKAPVLPPGGPVWRFPPRVGERPAPARSGAGLGHTGPSLAERKEISPTRKTTASVTGEYVSFRLSHQANGFPKTRSGERCEKRAGERPGVAGGVPCRVTSPGRAGR